MKRMISLILTFAILFSIGLTPAYAASEEGAESEIRIKSSFDETAIFNKETDDQIIELDSELGVVRNSDEEYAVSDFCNPTIRDIDLSTAINVTEEFLGKPAMLDKFSTDSQFTPADTTIPTDLPENQPPVDNCEFLFLNPESLKDGQYTTDSQFLLVTRYNNVDLCYDPDGTDFYFVTNSEFPTGYYEYVSSSDGSLAGYLFNFFNAGSYLLGYAFIDIYGGKSETVIVRFDIASRGAFEVIEGELDSVTDTNQFEITVDYSIADEYCLGLLRTGTGGTIVTAYYSDGSTEAGHVSTEGPDFGQQINDNVTLSRPDNVTGEYTYILNVKTLESDYVEGDTKYRIAYGESSQKYYFFEGATNCMELPYYTTTANYKSVSPAYNAWAATSKYGHYYKITATGPEVVTLDSNYGQYSFKILDCDSLETLYDGINLPRTNYQMYTPTYSSSAYLDFEAGKSYYIVVYDSEGTDYRGCYCIMAGQRHIVLGRTTVELDSASIGANVPVTWSFNLDTPTGYPAYIHNVNYRPKGIGAPTFTMLAPGSRVWNLLTLAGFDSRFDQGAAPIRADGQWQFQATSHKATTFPGATVDIYYWFEI